MTAGYRSLHSDAAHQGNQTIRAYALHLIDEKAHMSPGMDPGGASVYHEIFSLRIHADEDAREAFNAARRTPLFAAYLAQEINDSMFDDSFGDAHERTGDSHMSSAFANMMADQVLQILGEDLMMGKFAPGG